MDKIDYSQFSVLIRIAAVCLVFGKLTGLEAAALILNQSPPAGLLLFIYAFLIILSLSLSVADFFHKKKERIEGMTREEVEELARKFEILN